MTHTSTPQNIRASTLQMQAPGQAAKRSAHTSNAQAEWLIIKENELRRSAYRNTSIHTGEAFFDDSDMCSPYYLIVVYDEDSGIPLLSARYYFESTVIDRYVKGAGAELGKGRTLFLVDRMSANLHSGIYRRHRDYIHFLFYSELVSRNKGCTVIAMARKEKPEKLLAKYLRLGLRVIDDTVHQGKEHWILTGELEKNYSHQAIKQVLSKQRTST